MLRGPGNSWRGGGGRRRGRRVGRGNEGRRPSWREEGCNYGGGGEARERSGGKEVTTSEETVGDIAFWTEEQAGVLAILVVG